MNKNVNWRFFFFFFPSFIFRILGIIIRTYYALRKRSWPLLPTLVLSRGVTEQHTAQPLLFVCVCAWSGREWRPLLLLRFYQTAISKSLFLSYFAKAPERDLRVGGKRRSQILPWVVYSLICTREKKKSRAEQSREWCQSNRSYRKGSSSSSLFFPAFRSSLSLLLAAEKRATIWIALGCRLVLLCLHTHTRSQMCIIPSHDSPSIRDRAEKAPQQQKRTKKRGKEMER